jgi:PAS domain S-box-containing protein
MADDIRDLEERFFSMSIDMLCIADFSGYFRKLNPAWERVLGFTREELQSRPMFEFVHPEDLERTRAQNLQVRAGGQALSFENRYRCKDGSYRWLLWNARSDPDNQLIYSYCKSIRDDENYWQSVEAYISRHTHTRFTHGICPKCFKAALEAEGDENA